MSSRLDTQIHNAADDNEMSSSIDWNIIVESVTNSEVDRHWQKFKRDYREATAPDGSDVRSIVKRARLQGEKTPEISNESDDETVSCCI